MLDEIAGCLEDQRIRIEILQRPGFVQAPGEQDRHGDFVELDAVPIGLAIDPEVLVKAAVLVLRASEIDERAQRHLGVAGGQQGRWRCGTCRASRQGDSRPGRRRP